VADVETDAAETLVLVAPRSLSVTVSVAAPPLLPLSLPIITTAFSFPLQYLSFSCHILLLRYPFPAMSTTASMRSSSGSVTGTADSDSRSGWSSGEPHPPIIEQPTVKSPKSKREDPIHHLGTQTSANKAYSRMLGSATAGGCELLLFHPVDTITKRLMSTKTKYIVPGQTASNLNQIIFRQHVDAGALTKVKSLFPGLGFAAGYKVLQRTYKFGGQPFVNESIENSAGSWFLRTFGDKQGKTLMQATAGSIIGIGEVILLPLDVLKIKAQTNPAAFGDHKGWGMVKMLFSEGRSLYAGAGATAMRNAPGSFALFGGAELTYQYAFGIDDRKKASVAQHLTASVCGSFLSIACSAPLDTIKTRIQNQNFGSTIGGMAVFRDLIRNEGPTALWKGLTPKMLMVGPKLVFSMTIANWLIAKLTVRTNGNGNSKESKPDTSASHRGNASKTQ